MRLSQTRVFNEFFSTRPVNNDEGARKTRTNKTMTSKLVTATTNVSPLTADDLADIASLFGHTARSWAADVRDLRAAGRNTDRPLTFGLRAVFPSNTN